MGVSELPKLSVRLSGGVDPRRSVDLANLAEANGFHSVWFAENAFNRGVLPAVSACAAATLRVGVGIGGVNPFHRAPPPVGPGVGARAAPGDGPATRALRSAGAAARP